MKNLLVLIADEIPGQARNDDFNKTAEPRTHNSQPKKPTPPSP